MPSRDIVDEVPKLTETWRHGGDFYSTLFSYYAYEYTKYPYYPPDHRICMSISARKFFSCVLVRAEGSSKMMNGWKYFDEWWLMACVVERLVPYTRALP